MRFQFDDFELDAEGARLLRGGAEVPLERRPFELLCYLVAHPGRLVRKRELREKVWQAESLSEGVLANTVAKLRKALGQAADARVPLETVRGVGYRWHAEPAQVAVKPKAPQLVARHAERAQLSAAIDAARSGAGQLLLIEGEPGIGKTTLLQELENQALARGFSVWHGAGYDASAASAYWPWVQILRAARAQLSAPEWRRVLPERCSALTSLTPELCSVHGVQRVLPATPALRFQLFDELTRLLQAASTEAPRLIVIDDLHWADAASIELLAYAAHALKRSAVLLAAALRPGDLEWEESSLAAVRRLQRQASCMRLQGLSTSEVSELVASLSQENGDDDTLARALEQRSRGNPLFVRQLLAWLQQRGPLSTAALLQLTEADLPPALRAVIEQRLAVLPQDARHALGAAAVIGLELDAQTLAELLEQPLAVTLQWLELAERHEIVLPSSQPAAREWTFTHSLVRDALYAALGSARSGALHARLARTLAARASTDARQLANIAHHSLLAVPSDIEESVRCSLRAASAARSSGGFEAASAIALRVLRKHERESSDLHQRCEILLTLGLDQRCAGQRRAAFETLRAGAELALQLRAAELLARFAAELIPWLEFGGADERFVWMLLAQATQHASANVPAARASLLAQRAQVELTRPLLEREAWLCEAEAIAAAANDLDLTRQVTFARAAMRCGERLADNAGAIERYRVLERASRAELCDASRLVEQFSIERVAYTDALLHCDNARALAAAARCKELAHSTRIAGFEFVVELMNAGRALAQGALSDLEKSVQRLYSEPSSGGGFDIVWLRYLALLLYERDLLRHSPALDISVPGIAELPSHGRVGAEIFLAWIFAAGARESNARHALLSLDRQIADSMPLCREDLALLCMLAEVCCVLGERERAARVQAQLKPFAALNAVGPTYEYLGSVAHYLGMLAALLGQHHCAAAHFEHAAAVNRGLGMPLQLARTQAARARCVQ